MRPGVFSSDLTGRPLLGAFWVLAFTLLAVGSRVQSQEPSRPADSVAEAARNAREQALNSTKPAKIITNDDLAPQTPLPSAPVTETPASAATSPTTSSSTATASTTGTGTGTGIAEASASKPAAEVQTAQAGNCNNPEDERLKAELQAAQDELDQIRSELSYNPQVISDNDVDMTNFKSGSSGVAFGSPPLLQTQPQDPARVNEVILEQKIASLKEAERIACDSPEDAGIQRRIDAAEKELKLLQQQFDLDRTAFYSKPDYTDDPAGKAKLDDEQQQIQSLQSEIDSLKAQLPPPSTEQTAE